MSNIHTVVVAAVVSLTTVATAAAAEITYRRQVLSELRDAARLVDAVGYDLVEHTIEILPRRQTMTRAVQLRRGSVYAVAGVCVNDCDGISLRLIDENGNVVDQASGGDRLAVSVRRAWTGLFHIQLTMTRCRESLCNAGVAVFKR